MNLMGIDPGLQGSIVAVRERVVSVWRMPLMEGKRTRIDVIQVADIIGLAPSQEGPDIITMEACQSMPKQGAVSTFNYGVTYGELLAIVTLARVPFRVVSPQSWKRRYGLAGNEKLAALEVATRRLPTLRELLYNGDGTPLYPKAIRISMCEAALLALF
jgi:crossover junction endodeoxyribonuclease RuvC